VTAEARFYQRFVEDVRRCADGRDPGSVAEIARRVRVAMIAAPSARQRRWGRVVSAVDDLLSRLPARPGGALARLRTFVRENGDLGRPHDVAITDFRFDSRPERMLIAADGHSYLVLALSLRAPLLPVPALDEVVPGPTRRLAEWAVYAVCGGGAAIAFWLTSIIRI
jgi:hypothetical protein